MNVGKFENFLKDDETQNPITLRAFVPQARVGVLLGTKGHTHQQIQDIYNVRIILNQFTDDLGVRLMYVFGRPTNTARACREALIRMYRAFSASAVQASFFFLFGQQKMTIIVPESIKLNIYIHVDA